MFLCVLCAVAAEAIPATTREGGEGDTTKFRAILVDDFEDYTAGAQIITTTGLNTWNTWNANAHGDFVAATVGGSQRGYMTKTAGAWTVYPVLTLFRAQSNASSGAFDWTWRFAALPTVDFSWFRLREADTDARISIGVHPNGHVYAMNNAAYTDTGKVLSIDTDYAFSVTFTSTTAFTLTIDGTIYGPYSTFNLRTDPIVDVRLYHDATTSSYYIDNIVYREASAADGLTCIHPDFVATDDSCHPMPGDYVDLTDYVVFNSDQGIARMTKATGAVAVVKSETKDAGVYYAICKDAGGKLHAARHWGDANSAGNIIISTDNGATWSNGTVCTEAILTFLIAGGADGVFHIFGGTKAGDTHLILHAWTWTGAAWSDEGEMDTGNAVVSIVVNGVNAANGWVSGTDWYLATDVDGSYTAVNWMKVDMTANTITTVATIAASRNIRGSPGESVLVLSAGATLIINIEEAGSIAHIYKSVDSGANWTDIGTTQNHTSFPRYEELGTRYYVAYEEYSFSTDGMLLEWNTSTSKLQRVIDMTQLNSNITDLNVPVTKTGYLLCEDSAGYTRTYLLSQRAASEIIDCQGYFNIAVGARYANRVEFKTSSANAAFRAKGDLIELYDAWNTLWFKGTVTSKKVGQGTCTFVACDSTRDLSSIYAGDFDAVSKCSAVLTTLVNTTKLGYAGTIQDVNTIGGNIDYNTSVQNCWQPYLRTHRALERGVVWVTPQGAWNFDHYDDLDATGYRWKYLPGSLQVSLQRNEAPGEDSRATRASCMYMADARQSYTTGASAREATEGIIAARELYDVAIGQQATALAVATQLYNIFSTATTFLHVIATNHGLLQPGKTVDVSWSLGDTTVARTTACIVAVHAYMLQDVQEVVLSNNICLEHEIDNLELTDES